MYTKIDSNKKDRFEVNLYNKFMNCVPHTYEFTNHGVVIFTIDGLYSCHFNELTDTNKKRLLRAFKDAK